MYEEVNVPVAACLTCLPNLATVGPFLPRDRSLPVLVGGGYVIGDFMYTAFMGAGGVKMDAIRRRRIGVVVGGVCLIAWLIGHLRQPVTYPWIGAEHALVDVGGWFGLGPIAVAAILWALIGRRLFTSMDIDLENDIPEQTGRSFGAVLAGAYLFVWAGIVPTPSDGHRVVETVAGLLP